MVQLYLLGGSIVLIGFVWFWIVRPITVAAWDMYLDWQVAHAPDSEPSPLRQRPRPPLRTPRIVGVAAQRVNTYVAAAPIMSRENAQTGQTAQTDTQTDQVSEADRWLDRVELDRSKTALIELLVYSGWDVGQIRSVIKGDNGTLGTEIDAARKRLGMTPDSPRTIVVRDNGTNERRIPIVEPAR